MTLKLSVADRAFVRHLIREMRSAIRENPEAPTVTTGPMDPDVLERVLLIAMQESHLASDAGWRDIASAPRDGSWILAMVGGASERWEHLNGRAFVIRHEGKTPSDFDLGWSMYPGFGGVSDCWFTHWMPLPSPPAKNSESSPSEASAGTPATDEQSSSLLSPPQAVGEEKA